MQVYAWAIYSLLLTHVCPLTNTTYLDYNGYTVVLKSGRMILIPITLFSLSLNFSRSLSYFRICAFSYKFQSELTFIYKIARIFIGIALNLDMSLERINIWTISNLHILEQYILLFILITFGIFYQHFVVFSMQILYTFPQIYNKIFYFETILNGIIY